MIPEGESATIEVTDDREWCRIRASNGIAGWFRIDGDRVGFPLNGVEAHKVFDGLCFAD